MAIENLAERLAEFSIPERWRTAYLSYANNLSERSLPVIFESRHLGVHTGVQDYYIRSLINSTEKHYRTFFVSKKTGGQREICVPSPGLLHVQRWINRALLPSLKVSESAHAYVRGRSIVTHARIHCGSPSLLKIDLSDFFGSIKFDRVAGLYNSIGYSPDVSYDLARLCTFEGKMPQGAATSPSLSNIVFYQVDIGLYELARRFGLSYSRYSDDICVSGNYISHKAVSQFSKIIEANGFVINAKKTRLLTRRGRRIVTGLSIKGDKPKPTRQFRRNVRQAIYELRRLGLSEYIKQSEDPFIFDRVMGSLCFWRSVEPENQFVNQKISELRAMYAAEAETPTSA